MTRITQADLGWTAAVLDLRGIILYKNNKQRAEGHRQIVVAVHSQVLPVTDRLGALVGTKTDRRPRPPEWRTGWDQHGCVEHCPEKHVHHPAFRTHEIGTFTVTGSAAAVVLWNVRPWLADTGNNTRPPGAFRASYDEIVRDLILKGPGSGAIKGVFARLMSMGWALPPEIAAAFERNALRQLRDAAKTRRAISATADVTLESKGEGGA